MSPARLATLLAFALALLPLHAAAEDAPARENAITLPPSADHVTIPLARHFDVPTVAVTIAGQDAGRFLIDTGSPHTIVDIKLAHRLRLPTVSPPASLAPDSPQPPLAAELRQVTLGGVPAGSRFAFVREIEGLGPGITGILGTGILRDTPFTLDLRNSTLTFYRASAIPPELKLRGTPTALQLDDGYPVIRATLDGRPGRFALDTASTGLALTVTDAFALRDQDIKPQRRLGPDTSPDAGRTRFDRLDLPGKSLTGIWGNLVERHTAAGQRVPRTCVGVLGPRALRDARITMDFANERAWLEWPPDEDTATYVARLLDEERTQPGTLAPIGRAIDDNRPDALRALIEKGADPNTVPTWGAAACARAAGSPDLLRLLLAHDADASAIGPDGRPVLLAATDAGNAESLRLLLAAGAPADAATPGGYTPLHRAAEVDDLAILEALLAAHANPNTAVKDGTTPLMLAALNGSARALDTLLAHHPDLAARTELGYTALHAAAMSRRPAIVRRLIDAGADVNAPATDGSTPLVVAALEDDPDVIAALLAAGARPDARLTSGMTPLAVAVSRGHTRAVDALRPTTRPTLAATAPPTRIPLAWCQSAPCARVTLDGKDAGWFIISLRTPAIIVDTKVARQLNLTRLGSARPNADLLGVDATEMVETSTLAIQTLNIGPRALLAADLGNLPYTGVKISGILGWPALLDQPVTLDLREPSLTIYPAGPLPASVTAAAMPLRARFLPVGPVVWARVGDEAAWLRLDSTVPPLRRIELADAFATARPDLLRHRHVRHDLTLQSGRALALPVAQLDALAVAGQRFTPTLAAVSPPTTTPWRQTFDGVLPLPTRDVRITLDPQSAKAYLEWLPVEPLDAYLQRISRASAGPSPRPPLLRAVADDRAAAVRALLERGVDPNATGPDGVTPLLLAADRPALVEMLLKHNANPDAAAAFLGHTPLLRAAEAGNAKSVELLLAAGVKIDHPNTLGQTACFRAAEADHADVVDLLAKSGADVNRASREGWTPLTIAVSRESTDAVVTLLRHRADPNLPAAGQAPPLGIAALRGHADIARLLIAAGAELDRPNGGGLTPLMAAAATNQPRILRLLLSCGASPAIEVHNLTAEALAIQQSSLDALTILRFETPAR